MCLAVKSSAGFQLIVKSDKEKTRINKYFKKVKNAVWWVDLGQILGAHQAALSLSSHQDGGEERK